MPPFRLGGRARNFLPRINFLSTANHTRPRCPCFILHGQRPSGPALQEFATMQRRNRNKRATPREKPCDVSCTQRTSRTAPRRWGPGDLTWLVHFNAPSPPYKHTTPSNVRGYFTDGICESNAKPSWRASLPGCRRRWTSCINLTRLCTWRRIGRMILELRVSRRWR